MKKVEFFDNIEGQALYFDFSQDFPQLGCQWIMTTCGNPITECECDDDATLDKAADLITNGAAEECSESDYEYISGLCSAWNI